MTIPQQGNEWKVSDEVLDIKPSADDIKVENIDIKWFDYQQESWGDTPEEKHERVLVDKELTQRGILNSKPRQKVISIPEHSGYYKPSQTVQKPIVNDLTNFKQVEKPKQNFIAQPKKVGPNEPCPCNSGIKYKKCHGRGKF